MEGAFDMRRRLFKLANIHRERHGKLKKVAIACVKVMFAIQALLLSGCADRIELERLAHVVVLGLDMVDDHFIRVTFQIANPQVGSTDRGQSEKEPSSDIVAIVATDIMTARELANTIIPRQINFTHLQTLIVSEELARSEHFHHTVASMVRQPEMRREMHLIITREPAFEFIKKNTPLMETRPHKYYEFMMEQWATSGVVPVSTLNEYMKDLSGELFVAIYATTRRIEAPNFKFEGHYRAGEVPAEKSDPAQIVGSAVFKEGKMIGTLTAEETRYVLLLGKEGTARAFISSFPDPLRENARVTARLISLEDTHLDVDVSGEVPKISAKIKLYAQLLSIQGLTNYVTNINNQRVLERSIEEKLEEETLKFVRRTQEEFRGDPFGWHQEARKKFWTWQDYLRYDFFGKYPRAEVKVEYDIFIESFGKQFEPERLNDNPITKEGT